MQSFYSAGPTPASKRRPLVFELLLLSLAVFVACNRGSLDEEEVSGLAKASFAEAYPNVSKVKWERAAGGFEAEWEQDGVEYGATYTGTGDLVETEREFERKDIPAVVREAVTRDYGAKADIEEIAEITRGGKTSYEVEVEIGKREVEAMYSPTGERLSEKDADKD